MRIQSDAGDDRWGMHNDRSRNNNTRYGYAGVPGMRKSINSKRKTRDSKSK